MSVVILGTGSRSRGIHAVAAMLATGHHEHTGSGKKKKYTSRVTRLVPGDQFTSVKGQYSARGRAINFCQRTCSVHNCKTFTIARLFDSC